MKTEHSRLTTNEEHMNATDKTTAEQLLFQLQFIGMVLMVGRTEEAYTAYQKALALAKELIEAGH